MASRTWSRPPPSDHTCHRGTPHLLPCLLWGCLKDNKHNAPGLPTARKAPERWAEECVSCMWWVDVFLLVSYVAKETLQGCSNNCLSDKPTERQNRIIRSWDPAGIQNWFGFSAGLGWGYSRIQESSVRLGAQQQIHRKRRELSFYFSTLYLIKHSNVEWKPKDVLQFDFICYELTDLFGSGSRVCRGSDALAIHEGDIKHNGFLLLCCL